MKKADILDSNVTVELWPTCHDSVTCSLDVPRQMTKEWIVAFLSVSLEGTI